MTAGKCLPALVLLCAAAWAEPPAAGTRPAEASLSLAELTERLRAAAVALPSLETSPSAELQRQAAEICELYPQAVRHLKELAGPDQVILARMGTHAGFFAGHAEVMVSGARLLWRSTDKQKPAADAAAVVAWAGILAGDAALAAEALDQVIAHSPAEPFARWARSVKPIAKDCDKPVRLTFKLLDGRTIDTAQLHGKVIALDFWATPPGGQLQRLPEVQRFHEQRREDKKFVMIGLSLDEEAVARRGIRESGMAWPQAVAGGLRRRFHGRGAPHLVVISPDGRVIWQGHPVAMDRIRWVTDFARRAAARMAKTVGKTAPPATQPASATAPAAKGAQPVAESEAQADRLYRLATAYRKAGLPDRAKSILREIIRRFPNTSAARKAGDELRE